MPIYVDQPRWERHHGLSGHLIADDEAELDAFGENFGLTRDDRSRGTAIPHFLLAAGRRAAAIEAGAIPLTPAQWTAKLKEIAGGHQHTKRERPRPKLASMNQSLNRQLGLFNSPTGARG